MILQRNLRRVGDYAGRAQRVLAVGAAAGLLNAATHVIDGGPYDAAGPAIDPHTRRRSMPGTWTEADICATPWPYPDKYFDFSFCSHVLEDVRDPLAVLREISRVSRAGYIETPSRARESFVPAGHPRLAAWLGRPPAAGFANHRWYVENVEGQFRFLAKTAETTGSPDYVISRRELGRDLTEDESGLGVFWSNRIDGREIAVSNPREIGYELRGFKQRILYRLRSSDRRLEHLGDARAA
ncbi:MAG: methyltransferase domain-containing protein [Alphaproteobacteria bacterium]|nr:methyltransferase domain-containing protein [Alphaproteobacteria bacterium]